MELPIGKHRGWRRGRLPVLPHSRDVSTSLVSRRFSDQPNDLGGASGSAVDTLAMEIVRTVPERLSATVVGLIAERGWGRVVSVRTDRVGHPSVLGGDENAEALEGVEAIITEVAAFIEPLQTVVLDHSLGQGRAGLTECARTHVCVVRGDQVVATVQQASERVQTDEATWIGPRDVPLGAADVEGPGPDLLVVVLVESEAPGRRD